MEIFRPFIQPLMSCIGTPVIRQFGYLFNAKENVEELIKSGKLVKGMKKDIQDQLAVEERLGKQPTEEVKLWIKNVDKLSLEVTAVQGDYEQSGRCGCRLPNCWSSYYKIGRRASKLLMKLKPLQEERASLTGERLAIYAPPPSVVQQGSSALVGDMIHSNKEKICGYLKEEETDGVIGILGMGGVGKTTLLEAINDNVLSNNGTHVIRQFGYLFNAKENVEELMRHAQNLEAVKEDIQDQIDAAIRYGKRCTNEVERWIESVEDLSLDVTAVQRDYEQSGRYGCRLPSYYNIGRRASKLLMKLNALKEERARRTGDRLAIDAPLASVVPQMSSALVGDMIHLNKEKICGYLKEETDGVIGIVGMGGVGKTTLLEAINDNFLSNNGNSATNNNLFDHVIFIVVSKEYQLENLQKMIVKKLGLRSDEDLVSQAQIISEYLEKKNFLLLLDDIWEVVQLKDLGIPYPCQAGSSSISGRRFRRKVVFTTRSLQVCAGMKYHKKIEVNCLEEVGAWDLFKENVGENIINLPEIRSCAKKMIEKCGGLPLALVVIGRAMATKEMPGEWDHALTQLQNSQPSNIPGIENEDKYFLRLKFSYDSLRDDKMRKCFLCCSLWSEDCTIYKEDLIMCWMGLGLIDGFEDIKEAYDEGDSLIGSLIVASLLQPVQGKDKFIKVHDVIRNLALWIACDSGTNRNKWLVKAGARLEEVPREVVANWEAAERISLMENGIKDLPPCLPISHNLLTLLLQKNYSFSLIPGVFFTCMPNLTYLDLSNTRIVEIPKEICCLVQLRYLNLSFTGISSLSEELGQLINLKYLLVRHTRREVKVIRGIIGRLEKLVYLDLYPRGSVETDELVRLPLLKGVGMKITSEHALQQLSRVPIVYLNIKDYMEGDSSTTSIYLHHQLSLRELQFINCHSIRELVDVHLPRLESLQLSKLGNLTEIVWRRSIVPPSECFQRLRDLTIKRCHGLKDITWVLHLLCLEELFLSDCNGMEQLVVIGGGGEEERELEVTKPTFPRLRVLDLYDLPKLAMICDNHAAAAVNFPSLAVLRVLNCKELKRLPFHPQLINNNNCSRLESIVGEREWWEGIEWEDQSAQSSLLQPFFQEWPDL